jgi:hypothetical protein
MHGRTVGGLVAVLSADLTGVAAGAVATAVGSRQPASDRRDTLGLAIAVGIAFSTWGLAAAAVADVGLRRFPAPRDRARRLVWAGFVANTVLEGVLSARASVAGRRRPAIASAALAVGGAAASAGYLALLSSRSNP